MTALENSAHKKSVSPSLWAVAIIAMGMSVVGVGLSAYNYWSTQKSPTMMQFRMLAAQLNSQKIQALFLQQRVANLSAALPLQSQKTMAEVSYLVTIANMALVVNQDPTAALNALKQAQTILGASNDARLMGLSAAIQSDREALRKAAPIDTSQLFSTLSSAIDKIQVLSNVPAKPVFPTAETPVTSTAPTVWYQKYWEYVARLKNLVIIRHNNENHVPLVSAEIEMGIKQNITTQLIIAQTALLNKNAAMYKMALQNAQSWLGQYFPPTIERETINTLLSQLAVVDIAPALPTLTNTMNALALVNNTIAGA